MIEETEGKSSDRKSLFKELVRELKAHAAAEEQALWSTVLRDPEATDFARHAISEHKEIDDMLADLAARDMASLAGFGASAPLRRNISLLIAREGREHSVPAKKGWSATTARILRRVSTWTKKRKKGKTETAVGRKKG